MKCGVGIIVSIVTCKSHQVEDCNLPDQIDWIWVDEEWWKYENVNLKNTTLINNKSHIEEYDQLIFLLEPELCLFSIYGFLLEFVEGY